MKKISFSQQKSSYFSKKNLVSFLLNIILTGFTLFLSFFILEAYFSYYYSQIQNTAQTAMNLPIYQESSIRSWDHKAFAQADQGYGTPTPHISINSIGLRDDEIPVEKTRKRYLMLGDSFTFGMGVDQDKPFPQYLQKFLGEKYHKVINAGVIGQTIDDAFMYLKYEGMKLQPDYVIYNFFVGNDVTELRRHSWEKDASGNITQVQDTILHVDEKNRLRHRESKEPQSYFLFWLSEKWNLIEQKYGWITETIDPTLTWPVFLAVDNKDQDANINLYWWKFEETLKQMKAFCDAHNIELIVSIIPMDVQVAKKYWKKYPGMPFDEEAFEAQRPQKYMKLLGEKYKIPVFDVLPFLQEEEKNGGELYFDNDPHFSVLGHRFTAAYLWRYLMDTFL